MDTYTATHKGPDFQTAINSPNWVYDMRLKCPDHDVRTSDVLRNNGNSFPLWVKWVDGFGFNHEVILDNKDQSCSVLFPASDEGCEIKWTHGGGEDRTTWKIPFLSSWKVKWCKVRFSFESATLFNSHGIRVEFDGSHAVRDGHEINWDFWIPILKEKY